MNLERVRAILLTDPVWCGYALADLHPPFASHAEWHSTADGVLLVYHGFDLPMLFAHGEPASIERLLNDLPAKRYEYALMGVHKDMLKPRMLIERQQLMWRMVCNLDQFRARPDSAGAQILGNDDLEDVRALFADHPDQPDAFSPAQMTNGVFYGIFEQDQLVSLAGTHVVSPPEKLAALGNVFTHPDWRGRGLATLASAAVLSHLLEIGVKSVILNVAMDNEAAIQSYRHLGFTPFCGYYEGVAQISSAGAG